MKGWFLIALVIGVIYYLVTETDKLDQPIAQTDKLLLNIEQKIKSMTGTTLIRVDKSTQNIKQDISERMSDAELSALDSILESKETLLEFKASYCSGSDKTHAQFSKDNLYFICDKIQ